MGVDPSLLLLLGAHVWTLETLRQKGTLLIPRVKSEDMGSKKKQHGGPRGDSLKRDFLFL